MEADNRERFRTVASQSQQHRHRHLPSLQPRTDPQRVPQRGAGRDEIRGNPRPSAADTALGPPTTHPACAPGSAAGVGVTWCPCRTSSPPERHSRPVPALGRPYARDRSMSPDHSPLARDDSSHFPRSATTPAISRAHSPGHLSGN